MRKKFMLALSLTSLGWVSCAQHEVREKVEVHAHREGGRYIEEVAAQSPFETLEVSWAEARGMMQSRNLSYLKARQTYEQSLVRESLGEQFQDQLKDSLKVSMKGILKPNNIAKSLQDPFSGVPEQLQSVSGMKNIGHSMTQREWQRVQEGADAKLKMRQEQVKMYTLLARGEVIQQELERLETEQPEEKKANPKQLAAQQKWRASLEKERAQWLQQVRDLFNAEYYDVKFVRDGTAMPHYRGVAHPDFNDWLRWCFLSRSQKLIKELKQTHKKGKPAVPGSQMVKSKVHDLMKVSPSFEAEIETQQLRKEVRTLIANWREMKQAQAELQQLESNADRSLAMAKKLYQLRKKELQHASNVWLLDEHCWLGDGVY